MTKEQMSAGVALLGPDGSSEYKFNFTNGKIYENNIPLNANSILLGRFEGGDEVRAAILNEKNIENVYKLFLENSGNYARVSIGDDGSVEIIAGACINIYYYIENEWLYFSNYMIDVENLAASANQIDYDSVYYYIASGNYPPMESAFWKNIHKVSGEHHVIIFKDGRVKDKKWTFYLSDRKINKKEEYEEIMHFEAEGLKNWLKTSGKKPYCLISGVDSFNSFLALRNVGVCPAAIHANVNELQRCYVNEFIKEYTDTDYIEMTGTDFSTVTVTTILDSYKKAITPFLAWSTDTPISDLLYMKEKNNAAEITGDFAGLTMAIKAYNSTLNQHSFWGRHLLGSIKRNYFSDNNLMKANRRFGKPHSLYDFMTSIFLPTENFNALVPFEALKEAAGLDESEKQVFINIVHKYIYAYASSVKWDLSCIYKGNVGKLFRSYKRELYMAGLPLSNESRNYLYGIERLSMFSSIRASLFEDNYSLDFYNDIYRSKKCVYDYFDVHHPVDMVTMARKAFRAFRKKLTFKRRLAMILIDFVGFIPRVIKNSDMYQKLKRKCSFLKKTAGYNVGYHIGAINIDKVDDTSEFIRFSDRCEDKVMQQYFLKLENSISGKDMMEYSPVEERYVALSVYLKERMRKSQK